MLVVDGCIALAWPVKWVQQACVHFLSIPDVPSWPFLKTAVGRHAASLLLFSSPPLGNVGYHTTPSLVHLEIASSVPVSQNCLVCHRHKPLHTLATLATTIASDNREADLAETTEPSSS